MPTRFLHDPDAVLDYAFDWSAWLATGETITEQVITAADGLTVESSSEAGGIVTVWISGGTAEKDFGVTCRITTSDERTDERTITLMVTNR